MNDAAVLVALVSVDLAVVAVFVAAAAENETRRALMSARLCGWTCSD